MDGIVDPKDEKGQNVLKIGKRSIDRLNKMINDLLDFSSLESGCLRLHMNPCNLQILIDEALVGLKDLAERKHIKLTFESTKNMPNVECDPDRLVQVFVNLIGNALKFTPERGSVTVAIAEASKNQVIVTVTDTGIGIKPEDFDRIFERFEQVKGADSGGIKGTGLGLALCRELLRLHHGKIEVESEFGKGSKFSVVLPLDRSSRIHEKSLKSAERGKK